MFLLSSSILHKASLPGQKQKVHDKGEVPECDLCCSQCGPKSQQLFTGALTLVTVSPYPQPSGLFFTVAGQWSGRVPGCQLSLSAPEAAAPLVAGEFLHSTSRPCVTNSSLPSAWEPAEHPPWHQPKTEALGILLDSMTTNAPL